MLEVAKKYILAFPRDKEKDILDLIEKNQGIEVIEEKENKTSQKKENIEKLLQQTDYLISSLEFVISFLNPFSKKISLVEKIKHPKIVIEESLLRGFKQKEKIKAQVQRVIEIEKEMEGLERQKKEQAEKLKELDNFGNLDFVPQDTEYTFCSLGFVLQNQIEKITKLALKNGFYLRELQRTPSKLFFLLVGVRAQKGKALELLKECRGEVLSFNFQKAPGEEKALILQSLKESQKKLSNLKKELSRMAVSLKDLKIYYDLLCLERTKLGIKLRSLDEGFLNYILFWAQERKKKELDKKLRLLSSEITIVETNPEKGEEPPVILENSKAVKPFEYVTGIFGLPRGNEIDPTPYLSLFFILFFGICITDAGYGLLLALFTLLPLIFLKDLFKDTKLMKLLFYGGISTFVVGVLFGGYFGMSSALVSKIPVLRNLKMIDPIEDTVLFMGIAFGLGYLQLLFAQAVKIISGKRNKNKDMLFSGIAWAALLVFFGIMGASMKVPGLKNFGIFGILASGVGLMLAESRGQKIFLKPLAGGVKILQGLINVMSDILSYSRLMALGLATAVIALIVNQIALLFGDMIPYVGWVVAVLILIGGHIFNLGINALSGFIHSGRLQFVEFFPKFLEGGGKRLQPTKSELKYIKVG